MKLEKTIITIKAQNEQMKAQNEQMKAQNEQMKAQNEQMKAQNEQMKKEIEEAKIRIEQMKKEIEGIINAFTTKDVINNPSVKKLVLDTERLYLEEGFELFPNLIELAKIAKQ